MNDPLADVEFRGLLGGISVGVRRNDGHRICTGLRGVRLLREGELHRTDIIVQENEVLRRKRLSRFRRAGNQRQLRRIAIQDLDISDESLSAGRQFHAYRSRYVPIDLRQVRDQGSVTVPVLQKIGELRRLIPDAV